MSDTATRNRVVRAVTALARIQRLIVQLVLQIVVQVATQKQELSPVTAQVTIIPHTSPVLTILRDVVPAQVLHTRLQVAHPATVLVHTVLALPVTTTMDVTILATIQQVVQAVTIRPARAQHTLQQAKQQTAVEHVTGQQVVQVVNIAVAVRQTWYPPAQIQRAVIPVILVV